MLKKAAVLCCAAMLTLTACGGNSDADVARKNLRDKMMSSSDSLGTKATSKEATCIANGMVDKIGVKNLQKYKFLDSKLKVSDQAGGTALSQADAESFAKVYVSCVDMEKLLTERQKGASTFTQQQKSCISNALDEKVLEQGLAALFQGKQDAAYTKMQLKIQKCTQTAEKKVLPKQ